MSAAAHPLVDGTPPAWATCWGDSIYGPWAGFMENHIVYKMYWMPPGTFMMGSPETEVGRVDEAGLAVYFEHRRTITLTHGFWMAEHPCTQALWTAVMDARPSRFDDPKRPVEQVGWRDVRGFLERLNAKHPGLEARLPTEAEWEYACRAGTTTATYGGDLTIKGTNHAPELDALAWYGGNSGVDFDFADGHETPSWLETQYDFDRAATRRVGLKQPNPWGLYDMLGNVYEWCEDWLGPYAHAAQVDPVGPSQGVARVLRGGSWRADARYCRAADRGGGDPLAARDDVGFRVMRKAGDVEPKDPGA